MGDTKSNIERADKVRAALAEYDRVHPGEHVATAFRDLLRDLESNAWHRGLTVAQEWATADRERTLEAVLQVASMLAGKDRADGTIRFEVYPDPDVYDKPLETNRLPRN